MILTVLSHSVPQLGSTALMEASVSGYTDVVQLLLSSGAQVDLQDEVRHTLVNQHVNQISFDSSSLSHEQQMFMLAR